MFLIRRLLLLIAVLLLLTGCSNKTKESSDNTNSTVTNTTTVELSDSKKDIGYTNNLDILDTIYVEAGIDSLSPLFFFDNYSGQELQFIKTLTKEELSVAGASYELPIDYMGERLNILVNIIDTVPPVFDKAEDIVVRLGDNISYQKNITVSDNSSCDITLEIDKSSVDIDTPGIYPILYSAIDSSENVTRTHVSITITEAVEVTEEQVNQLADALIAQKITPQMTPYEKAYTLWYWCRNHIRYTHSSLGDRSSVFTGAYEGLHNRQGDCYTFYATYSLLLTRCGIENIRVERVGGTSNHWWNLVNLGNGWYHCDTSPRKDGDTFVCFMQTDAQVQAYTDSYPEHPNYYVFDETLYPERETIIIYGE